MDYPTKKIGIRLYLDHSRFSRRPYNAFGKYWLPNISHRFYSPNISTEKQTTITPKSNFCYPRATERWHTNVKIKIYLYTKENKYPDLVEKRLHPPRCFSGVLYLVKTFTIKYRQWTTKRCFNYAHSSASQRSTYVR